MTQARRNLTKMVIVFSFLFILSNATTSVLSITKRQTTPYYIILSTIANLLLYGTHSFSIFIYICFDGLYREVLASFYRKLSRNCSQNSINFIRANKEMKKFTSLLICSLFHEIPIVLLWDSLETFWKRYFLFRQYQTDLRMLRSDFLANTKIERFVFFYIMLFYSKK